MRGYDAEFLDEVKRKNDLVDTVSRYVQLQQRGNNFWGRCPFHHEKTPSFCVNAPEQFYYCFGCHQSGDVFKFIMEMESLDFGDAVKLLAERAHVPLPQVRYDDEQVKEQKKRKERVLALLRDAALFYAHNLRTPEAGAHVEYILKRKISSEYVMKFGMGASLDYDGLPRYLKSKGYTEQEMVDSGACGRSDRGVYDSLGGRLIIPVIDQFGNVIAFCGRIIDNRKNVGKYVNTRETCVFSKGKTLFNLNNLKKLKNEKGVDGVIIVEGHLDVVSLVQAGFGNVVASMGTSLTKDQARILKRYSDKVYISYDGDFAGQKASVRGLEILSEEGLDVKVVTLPDGMDPDDVIKNLGADGYRNCLASAMPLIDFKLLVLKKTYDLSTVDGKRKFASAAAAVIRESSSPAEQEDLLKTVRDATGFTFEALKRELYSAEEKKEKAYVPASPDFAPGTGDKITLASRFILYSCLFGKSYAKDADISGINFPVAAHTRIKDYVLTAKKEGRQIKFSDLYEAFGEEYGGELSLIASMETDENKRFDEEYFSDCVRTLRLYEIEKKTERLNAEFNAAADVEKRREIAKEINVLLTEKKMLL